MTQNDGKTRSAFSLKIKILIIVGTLGALALVMFVVLTEMARAEWERYAAALREDGPLTYADIRTQHSKIPDERNSALVIERLVDALNNVCADQQHNDKLVWIFEADTPDFFNGVTHHHIEPSRAFVERHRELLTELAVLHTMPTGRFKTQFQEISSDQGYTGHHLSQLRTAVKLEYLASTLAIVDGDLHEAANIVHLQFHISAALDEYPVTVGRIVQIFVETMPIESIENILRVGEVSERTLVELDSIIASRRAASTMKWAFLGSRAWFIETSEHLAATTPLLGGNATSVGGGSGILGTPELLLRQSQVCGTKMLTWLVEAADDPREMIQACARIEEEAYQLPDRLYLAKGLLMVSEYSAVLSHLRGVTNLDCARAAVAAERFRLATGRLPETLDQLVPDFLDAVPTDPFDVAPIRLTTADEGIVVYSIADNRRDDGGIVRMKNDRRNDGGIVRMRNDRLHAPDIGFRLLRPQHRGLLLIDAPPPNDDRPEND